ncbi:MAG: HAD family hydrolase [Acidobacteriota bacterium]
MTAPGPSGVLRPRALIFDLDGTLADSFTGIAHALDRTLREVGLPERGLPWVHRHVGRGSEALIRDAVGPEAADRADAVAARYLVLYRDSFLAETPPFPGAREVLAHVSSRTGGRVAVLSNKSVALCRSWMEYWQLAALVADVVGPETYGALKPAPAAVRPVLEALDARPEEALLVGDMTVDAETGRASGVPCVTVEGPAADADALLGAGATAVLKDLRELPGWLAANGTGWR